MIQVQMRLTISPILPQKFHIRSRARQHAAVPVGAGGRLPRIGGGGRFHVEAGADAGSVPITPPFPGRTTACAGLPLGRAGKAQDAPCAALAG